MKNDSLSFALVAFAHVALNSPLLLAQLDEIHTLDSMVIEGIDALETVVPSQQLFSSAFGSYLEILDTPRNVTIVSREQLTDISIQDVRDFSKLTASSYTPSNFGAPANPSIRSQTADVFVNGLRRGLTSNGNGLPINFNAVESVSIVKGPPTVIYGASQYVGGYVDLITKRPYFDHFRGVFTATVGMFDQYRWTLDLGGPIDQNKAYRFSYSGEVSGSYYEFGKKNTQALYGAITWNKSEDWIFQFNMEYFQADYTENLGWNRPTQDLIDNGNYITNAGTDEEYEAYVAGLQGSGNHVPIGETVKLSRRKRLLAPGDDSFGRQFATQAISTYRVNEDFRIINNSSFNYINRDTFSSYHYSEVLKDNWSIDNRTELHHSFEFSGIEVISNSGLHLRHQRVEAYNTYYVEPANAFDLTRDPETRRIPDSAIFWAEKVPGEAARGVLKHRYTNATNGDSGLSHAFQAGLFTQGIFCFHEKFSMLAGLRLDVIYADYENPLSDQFDANHELGPWSDSTTHGLPNWNISPIFKITEDISWYLTYNYSQSTGVGTGGGFVASSVDVDGDSSPERQAFNSTYFHRENELYESGMKFSLDGNRIFITSAVFHQSYVRPSLGGVGLKTIVDGFEFETTYQPNRNFYLNFAYSMTHAEEVPDFVASSGPFDVIAKNGIVTTPSNVVFPGEKVKKQATPVHLINVLARYKWNNGFGFSANALITGPYPLSYETLAFETVPTFTPIQMQTVVVPWQFSADLNLFYDNDNFGVRLTFLNLTDEKNFSPAHPVYSNDSVIADLPFRAECSIAYKF